jgi:dolichol-phosphate mannosyltransferase
MQSRKLLVFAPCYNECGNIGPLIDQVVQELPDADFLIVDDNSPDGTGDIIAEKKNVYPQITAVQRPRKLGIGSAHKYALFYAMREGYDTLVTMDADFSHDPRQIRNLLLAHGDNVFVTGSRYCKGGKSDYTGYRDLVSRMGNFAARIALGVPLRELTTSFRVFDVNSLRRIPLRQINAAGYSYGVQLVYHLRKAGVELREVPIHFVDRTHGKSKIPRLQILISAIDLVSLALQRLNRARDLLPDTFVGDACPNCGDRALALKLRGRGASESNHAATTAAAYRCTSVGLRRYPPVYTCLRCGLEQVPASLIPPNLEELYADVIDPQYLENLEVRRTPRRKATRSPGPRTASNSPSRSTTSAS